MIYQLFNNIINMKNTRIEYLKIKIRLNSTSFVTPNYDELI